MSDIEVEAMCIIKGEMNNDEFLWDAEVVIDGVVVKGAFKSQVEKQQE